MMEPDVELGGLFTEETWRDYLAEYQSFVHGATAALRQAAAEGGEDTVEPTDRNKRLSAQFLDSLGDVLASEALIAHDVIDGAIESTEREREIAKKALSRLKVEQLRRVAEDNRLDPKGKEEDLLDRIVTHFHIDEAKVAELVLAHEEARPDRGITDRLFPLLDPIENIDTTAERLRVFQRRYIRTGIAKWFIFSDLESDGFDRFVLQGDYLTYRADAVSKGAEDFNISAVPAEHSVRLTARRGSRYLTVRAQGVAEARAATAAVSTAADIRRSPGLEFPSVPAELRTFAWDPRTVFVADLLQNGLARQNLEIWNLNVAQFSTGDDSTSNPLAPNVRSVRFEGSHLLSSQSACELIVDGKALTDVSLFVRLQTPTDDGIFAPIRISIANDHLAVLTGFGANTKEATGAVHQALVSAVVMGLISGISHPQDLEAVARQIEERATTSKPVERADIFAPPRERESA